MAYSAMSMDARMSIKNLILIAVNGNQLLNAVNVDAMLKRVKRVANIKG